MPFLKPQRATWCERRIEACKRNGWRHAIYLPETKRITKAHYKGEWRNDKREGKGIGVNSHGWIYEGDWYNDQRHGYGVLSKITQDGDVRKVYAGNWAKGRKHGFGSNWYKDGSYYEGAFRENKRDGCGRVWYKCGSGYYQGTWLNDRYHGEGILIQDICIQCQSVYFNNSMYTGKHFQTFALAPIVLKLTNYRLRINGCLSVSRTSIALIVGAFHLVTQVDTNIIPSSSESNKDRPILTSTCVDLCHQMETTYWCVATHR
ncbi:MORN repeat-containing protein 3 [Trachymyrmex zeteki]|uniref:MORN repeat-containing protein 3 n=1 Tax=Mycetomoellerius zeteki TaxID=64791 RepID=A0A151XB19_9HYME|nr:MORN repeat-containing protein 3 [Trachymyrmex zeteki]